MRVSKCPQAAIVRCAARAEPAMLLSAQGLDVHVWQLGSALNRQHQVCTAVTFSLAVPSLQISLLCGALFLHAHHDTQGLLMVHTKPCLGAMHTYGCLLLHVLQLSVVDTDTLVRL